MFVVALEYRFYELPLNQPLPHEHQSGLLARKGIFVRLKSDTGSGVGEIAPLLGISQESLEMACCQLEYVAAQFPMRFSNWIEVEAWLKEQKLYPSVRFGLWMAFFVLFRDEETPFKQLLKTLLEQDQWVSINGLVIAQHPQALQKAMAYVEQGYKTLKIKVGYGGWEQDVKLLASIRKMAHCQPAIRLDMGGRLSLENSIFLSEKMRSYGIQYVEDPVSCHGDLLFWYEKTQMPYALDTLQPLPCGLEHFPGLVAVVVKPTLVGGIPKTDVPVVISSAFESGLALSMFAILSALHDQKGNFCIGASTHEWFCADTIFPPFRPLRGQARLRDCMLALTRGLQY